MGVPKFFRWLSERYPKIIQRHGSRPVHSTYLEHFGDSDAQDAATATTGGEEEDPAGQQQRPPPPYMLIPPPDPLSECGLAPEIDRLYIDTNGIIHGCSHNNSEAEGDGSEEQVLQISEEAIFRNVCYYLDRIIKDVAKPKELVYIAIDGVAPRAKLNQQRARRYRSGKEGEIERTVYDAHMAQLNEQQGGGDGPGADAGTADGMQGVSRLSASGLLFDSDDDGAAVSGENTHTAKLKEVEPGRFAGKFETTAADSGLVVDLVSSTAATKSSSEETPDAAQQQQPHQETFHSNSITPGTEFFARCTRHLQEFVERKVATDRDWQKLTVIFSGPNVPGEGEHKICQYMREQQQLPNYNPNLRHCIMGQDGDLILLGLATHEPNLVLLREKVHFQEKKRKRGRELGLGFYIHNPNFEFLHMNVLRDYLAFEFETSNVLEWSSFDLEHTIDDVVFMTFFVGNDFLPHMPALDIADEAFDLLFYTYRHQRKNWLKFQKKRPEFKPYLTDTGTIVSGHRLEDFLAHVGKHEHSYYDYKKDQLDLDKERQVEAKYGRSTTPSDEVIESKENADRERFREMIRNSLLDEEQSSSEPSSSAERHAKEKANNRNGFNPVLSTGFRPKEDDIDSTSLLARIGNLLEFSVSDQADDTEESSGGAGTVRINDQDLKGRYYYDKFGFSPFDEEKHIALRKAYVEGLVWTLKYYYEGCVSWSWYYPYHYGPMLSDLVGLGKMLHETSFEGRLGEPLKPFEQLMACVPPSHADLLPTPYRPLLKEESSPIAEFYPRSFTVDMNGKRWPWEAVVLLPFIDAARLLEAAGSVDHSLLTEDDIARNQLADTVVYSHDPNAQHSVTAKPLESIPREIAVAEEDQPAVPTFRPLLQPGVETPLSGLPTLRDGLVRSLWRKQLKVNVHGTRSVYMTSCLELYKVPEIVTVDHLAQGLIGGLVYINYPQFMEGFVTAVSDDVSVFRGAAPPRPWTPKERFSREERLRRVVDMYTFGEKQPGTGGIVFPGEEDATEDLQILIHVRPLKGVETLRDGRRVRVYAKFEVEVPFFVTSWKPATEDPRLKVPMRLEKDPYKSADFVLYDNTSNMQSAGYQRGPSRREPPQYYPPASFRSGPRIGSIERKPPARNSAATLTTMAGSASHSPPLARSSGGVTGFDLGRSEVVAVGSRFRGKSSFESAAAAKRIGPLRGRLLAAGFVAACSYLLGCDARQAGHADSPLTRVDVPSISRPWMKPGVPDIFENEHSEEESDRPFSKSRPTPPLEFAHGTTTLSFTFQGGIVAAVDSRASLGSFVGSKTTQKVLPVNSHVLGTMAGGAADCSFWIRQLRSEAAFYELTNESKRMSVARASRLLSNALYENRGLGLSIGTMIMGFDDDGNEGATSENEGSPPKIFYVDNTGMRIEGDLFAVGSGSTFALGILDTERRFDMTADEAVALGIKAIRHATFRDAGSGGFINVFLITRKHGWKRVYSEDLARLSKADQMRIPVSTEQEKVDP